MKSKYEIINETEEAIVKIKEKFQNELSMQLNLKRISSPIFLPDSSGLNDDLNGIERKITFELCDVNEKGSILHSLAKWKRKALKDYGFPKYTGLFTDMNAIRRDEVVSNIHSFYVDQWDWEINIPIESRTINFLDKTVLKIYEALRNTQKMVSEIFGIHNSLLPENLYFIDSQELEDKYPSMTPKEREYALCKEKKAIFIRKIGGVLKSGKPHDLRAPDYDDWDLNGDLLVYHDTLDIAMELSSMGIRVAPEKCKEQLELAKATERLTLPFHKSLIEGKLPYSIGGGIGQSRVCMFLMQKRHIGEVHVSIWPEKVVKDCKDNGIYLL